MLRRAKLWLIASLTGLGALAIFGAAAFAFNGPWSYSATVPWNGPWISGLHAASGSLQEDYTSTIGGSYNGDMNGQIVNSNNSNMSSQGFGIVPVIRMITPFD